MSNVNYTINQKQYQALKETGLNFEELSEQYLTKKEIQAINFSPSLTFPAEKGGSFANFSSFLKFEEKPKDAGESSKKSIKLLQNWDALQKENIELRVGYVLLGINAGTKGIEKLGRSAFEHFEMFQIRSRTRSPVKYQNAFLNTGNAKFYVEKVCGTYITDFVKGYPTATGAELMADREKIAVKILGYNEEEKKDFNKRFSQLFGHLLENELELLGGETHTLVVMGHKDNEVFTFLEELGFNKKIDTHVILNPNAKNPKRYKVKRVPHYSSRGSQSMLREQIEEAFK